MWAVLLAILLVVVLIVLKSPKEYPPSHILVIRHANKAPVLPGASGGGALDSQPLDAIGKQRAEAYIESLKEYAEKNYGQNFVNAYAIAPSPDYSMRPEQTIMPFCFTYSIPLHLPAIIFDPDLFGKFRSAIYQNPQNQNRPVLICFEHTCIQALIQSLGFPSFSQYWENSNYTVGIDIDVKAKSMKIVYFPFQEGDDNQYQNYISSKPQPQSCK